MNSESQIIKKKIDKLNKLKAKGLRILPIANKVDYNSISVKYIMIINIIILLVYILTISILKYRYSEFLKRLDPEKALAIAIGFILFWSFYSIFIYWPHRSYFDSIHSSSCYFAQIYLLS